MIWSFFFFLPVAVGAHLLNQMNSVRAAGMLDTLFHNIGSKFMLGQSENFAANRAEYKGHKYMLQSLIVIFLPRISL